jgi:hypothetical protein
VIPTSDDLPFSSRFHPDDRFLEFVTTKIKGASDYGVPEVTDVSEMTELMEEWLGPYFELKTIYEANSDDYTYDTLEESNHRMANALEKTIQNYLRNPKENPLVIIGLFASVGSPSSSDPAEPYNILAYFWIDPAGLEIGVIQNEFRIDIHRSGPAEVSTQIASKDRFNSHEMAEYWGLTQEELISDETCVIRFLTLNVISHPEIMGSLLNWTQFPSTLLGGI